MGDLVVSGDMTTQESSIPSAEKDSSQAKVSDPTGTVNDTLVVDTLGEPASRKSENQDSTVRGSAEVISSHGDLKHESDSDFVGSKTDQTILGSEVSLSAFKVNKMPETKTTTKSATVDSLKGLELGTLDSSRAAVDNTAPVESVRDAVSKFGGVADWKMHRVQTLEKHGHIDQELEKIQEEMIDCKNRSNAAEDSEIKVLNELERTNLQIKDLEFLLTSRRGSGAAAKEEELETVGESLDDVEITIRDLIAELVVTKASLQAAEAAYKEAEDQRSASVASFEVDSLRWESEVKQVEEEVEMLNQEYLYARDLKTKLDSASALLSILKAELGSYIGSRMKQESADAKSKTEVENSKMKFLSAIKKLEQVKLGTDKAAAEVSILKLAASSLRSELDKEKGEVSTVKKQVGMAMVTVLSLEDELSRIESETALIEMQKKEAREIMVDLPNKLQRAAEEADQAKSLEQSAHEKWQRVSDKAEQVNAEACTTDTRLRASEKEIEATKASEKLALAAIHGLQESETALDMSDTNSKNVVIISLDEYQMLSEWAQDAEEQAKTRLAAALIQIEAAKKSESKSLLRLEEVSQELSNKKVFCGTATRKSEKSMNEKLRVEQELRSWRTKNEQKRRASKSAPFTSNSSYVKQKKDTKKNGKVIATNNLWDTQSLKSAGGDQSSVESDYSQDLKIAKKKKKKSLFPRLLTFFGKRKSQASRKVMANEKDNIQGPGAKDSFFFCTKGASRQENTPVKR